MNTAQPATKYDTVLMFAQNTNCRFYDEPKYSVPVTLEDNLRSAISFLRSARRDSRKGVPNQEYLRYCKKNLREAIALIRNAEVLA